MVKPFFTLLLLPLAASLDNNVANTPPLGWCSWQRYRCAVACNDATSPECFNEGLIKRTADAMLAGGYLAAGYNYIAIDDCWQGINAKGLSRDADGHIFADKKRFPSGIKALADYVHSKGFKFGLYTAIGNETCAFSNPRPPYPDHSHSRDGLGCDRYSLPKCTQAKRDIDDFVSWGIDYLKVDGCREADYDYMNSSYAVIGNYLQEAALREQRPPPLYHPSNLGFKFPRQFRELASIANQWRFFDDAQPSWVSVKSIIDELGAGQPICLPGPLPTNCTSDLKLHGATSTYCASYCVERDQFRSVAGRGGWHDPDMVLIGATNCSAAAKKNGMKCAVANWTHVEEELQMAIWAMNSAPIMMSTNVNAIPDASRDILLNAEVLAIDQDPLGRMPFRWRMDTETTGASFWRKELSGGAVAVAIVNRNDNVTLPAGSVNLNLLEAGFSSDTRVAVRDLFHRENLGWHTFNFKTTRAIPPHGVVLLRLAYSPVYAAAEL